MAGGGPAPNRTEVSKNSASSSTRVATTSGRYCASTTKHFPVAVPKPGSCTVRLLVVHTDQTTWSIRPGRRLKQPLGARRERYCHSRFWFAHVGQSRHERRLHAEDTSFPDRNLSGPWAANTLSRVARHQHHYAIIWQAFARVDFANPFHQTHTLPAASHSWTGSFAAEYRHACVHV